MNSAGSATTAVLNATGFVSLASFGTAAGTNEVLNNGFLQANIGIPLTFTVTNVPYAAYSLVVYNLTETAGTAQSITAGGVSFFTLSPAPQSAGYIDNNAATPFTYTQGTGLTAATATANADYVLFPLLTGSTLTFTALSPSGSSQIAGFQIINIPEPSTCALALLGGAGLLGAVRRSRRLTARQA